MAVNPQDFAQQAREYAKNSAGGRCSRGCEHPSGLCPLYHGPGSYVWAKGRMRILPYENKIASRGVFKDRKDGTMRYSISALAAAAALTAAPAFAGSMDTAAPEPAPQPVPQMAPMTGDWTGYYLGGQLGYGDVDTDAGPEGSGFIGGLVAGYDYDFGTWVLGGGLDYDFADIDVGGAATLENVARLKIRGGYKIGNGLAYATAGVARAETDTLGNDTGYFVGLGYEHMITDQFALGGEALYHKFDDFNASGIDIDATTVQLRGTFRF